MFRTVSLSIIGSLVLYTQQQVYVIKVMMTACQRDQDGTHIFPQVTQNFDGYRSKDDVNVGTIATRWLVTQVTNAYRPKDRTSSGETLHASVWPIQRIIVKGKVFPLQVRLWPRGWVELQLYSFMTTALEEGEWSAVRPGRTLPPGKDPVPIVQEAGWAPGPIWTGGKTRLTGNRSPDRLPRNQSLYRPSDPAHITYNSRKMK